MVRSAVRKSPIRGTLDTVEEVSYVTLSSVSGLLLVCAIVAAGFWVATIYQSAKSTSNAVNAWRFTSDKFLDGADLSGSAQLASLTLDTMFQSIVVALLLILVAVALRSHGVFMS